MSSRDRSYLVRSSIELLLIYLSFETSSGGTTSDLPDGGNAFETSLLLEPLCNISCTGMDRNDEDRSSICKDTGKAG